MPKKTSKPKHYCKLKVGKHEYAVTYINGKRIYLGHYGSEEADIAYDRVKGEHARLDAERRFDPTFYISKEKAQHLLVHASSQQTDTYDNSGLEVREELARRRVNPFEME